MMVSNIATNQLDQTLGKSQVLAVSTPMVSSLGQQIIGESPTYISQIQAVDSLPAPTHLQLAEIYPLTNIATVPQTLYNVSTIQPVQSQVIPLTNVVTASQPVYNVSTIQPVQSQVIPLTSVETASQPLYNVSTFQQPLQYQTGSLVKTVLKPVVKTDYQSVIKYKPVVKTSYGVRTKYVPVISEAPELANTSISTVNAFNQESINLAQTVPLSTSVQVPNVSVVPQPVETVPLTTSVQVPNVSVVPQPVETVPLTTSVQVPNVSVIPQPIQIVPLTTSVQVPNVPIIQQPTAIVPTSTLY